MTIQQDRPVAAVPAPRRKKPVEYPYGDGKPMGETPWHIRAMIRLFQIFCEWFESRDDVYIGSDMCFYWIPGRPDRYVCPDVFVVFGTHKLPDRPVWKTWEEALPPVAIFEITSRSTYRRDMLFKRTLYATLGVQEYYLFDPLEDYLRPSFQGYRLKRNAYAALPFDADGGLTSPALGLRFRRDGRIIRVYDTATGEEVLDPVERAHAEAARAKVEAARAEAEAARAEAEAERAQDEARRAHAEAERADSEANARAAAEARIRELERLLAERGGPPGAMP